MDTTKTKLAWLAGLIDGEGCFDFIYDRRPRKTERAAFDKKRRARLRIVLQSRDKFVLEEAMKIAGAGKLYYRKPQKSWKPNCSDQWEWCLSQQEELLKLGISLLPFLVLKKQKCAELVSFIKSKKTKK